MECRSNIFAFVPTFIAKFDLWIWNSSTFDALNPIIDGRRAEINEEIQKNIALHLKHIKNEFKRCFPGSEDKLFEHCDPQSFHWQYFGGAWCNSGRDNWNVTR